MYVKSLTTQVVKDTAEIDYVMQMGKKNRSVGATLMNQTSSRSHSIFTIVVETLSENSDDGKEHVCVGKLNLVDLAGSERQSKTGATGDRLQEANKINLSLSALGNVISSLVDGKSKHIPYRDSKLTRLLQDSLGGNTKTIMIANCGPADYNYEETLTTLRYASRAKNIKNKPKINEDPKDAMIREFQDEIEALKAKLLAMQTSIAVTLPPEIKEVEKIVETIVIDRGRSQEEAHALVEKTRKEKEEVLRKAHNEMSLIAKDKAIAEKDKREIELRLHLEEEAAREMEKEQNALVAKLASLQEKLLVGGEMITKAAQQEDQLRQKQLELEARKQQELRLARELAEQEEANLMREEKYQSLQEEADAKARKLRKVYAKVKEAVSEMKLLEKAQHCEREDLIGIVRQLTAQLKLKTLIVDAFIPPAQVTTLENRATYVYEEDEYKLDRLELAGNSLRQRETPRSRVEPTSLDAEYFLHEHVIVEEDVASMRDLFFVYVSDEDGYAPVALAPKTKPSKAKKSSRKRVEGSRVGRVRQVA